MDTATIHRMRQNTTLRLRSQTTSHRETMRAMFDAGFRYSRRLEGHKSCVNALAFSSGDGRWLASAGDDLRVFLWDFHQENVDMPSQSFFGHRANIFCLEFSANNQYIYSGSTDEKIIKYDLSTTSTVSQSGSPCAIFTTHEDSIRGISCHPVNDEIFLSASDDGTVLLHDSRTNGSSSRASGRYKNACELTDVRFHPQTENLFVTSDSRGAVRLRDTRMAFTSSNNTKQGGEVLLYVTALSRKSVPYTCQPEVSSIAFDRDGKKFGVTFLHYFPTIYSLSDPFPVAVCSGRCLPGGGSIPDGERTYQNSCTIKHGSFGGPGLDEDMYYSTGSDDFRAYVWNIPNLSVLGEQRRRVDADDWSTVESPRTIGFAKSMLQERYVPVELDTPIFRLQGHRSIVNTSIIHPHLPQIVTAGVEKHITLHSPSSSAPNIANFQLTDVDVRKIPDDNAESSRRFLQAMISGPRSQHDGLSSGTDSEEDTEEEKTLAFFDGILRENETVNVFTARARLQMNEDSESESDDDMFL